MILPFLYQETVDFILAHRVVAPLLADIDAFSVGRSEFQEFLIRQVVVDDHLSLLQEVFSPEG